MAMTFSFSSSGVLVILSTDALIQWGVLTVAVATNPLLSYRICPGLRPSVKSAGDISHNSHAAGISATQQFLLNRMQVPQC